MTDERVRVGSGSWQYEWLEPWARTPDAERPGPGWAHPGLVVTSADELVTCAAGEPTLLVLDPAGNLLRSIPTTLTEGHGLAVGPAGAGECLWIADPGSKRRPAARYERDAARPAGQVVRMSLAGEVLGVLPRPPLPDYAEGAYSPTSVAVDDPRLGGSGDVWVADGYGQYQVHCYRAQGGGYVYAGSITGAEGDAGPFVCPHGIWIDHRKPEPELYVADRSNHRVQVYDLERRFKRAFGADYMVSPSAFAQAGDRLIVAELHARLTMLDADDRLVGCLGDNHAGTGEAGWPNVLDAAGVPTRSDRLQVGRFNSPHGLAGDASGAIYVSEWLIGGRTLKLRPS